MKPNPGKLSAQSSAALAYASARSRGPAPLTTAKPSLRRSAIHAGEAVVDIVRGRRGEEGTGAADGAAELSGRSVGTDAPVYPYRAQSAVTGKASLYSSPASKTVGVSVQPADRTVLKVANGAHRNWWSDPGMRALNWHCFVLLLGSYGEIT